MPSDVQKRIIMLRKKTNKSLEEIADALDMPRATYHYNETKAKRLSDEFIEQIAAYHKVSTSFIRDGLREENTMELEIPRASEINKLPFICTNSEKKMIEALRCLSIDRQVEIKKIISDEFKLRTGINDE